MTKQKLHPFGWSFIQIKRKDYVFLQGSFLKLYPCTTRGTDTVKSVRFLVLLQSKVK